MTSRASSRRAARSSSTTTACARSAPARTRSCRTRSANPALLDRLAAAYGLPIVDVRGPDDVVNWCRERGLGLSEEVVTSLLGPREREPRRLAPIALRLAGVAAVVAVLLVLGLGARSEGRAGPERPDGADPRRPLT